MKKIAKVILLTFCLTAISSVALPDSLEVRQDSSDKINSILFSDTTGLWSDTVQTNRQINSAWIYPLSLITAVSAAVFLLFSVRSK